MSTANPDLAKIREYCESADDGPVVMVNLMRFKSAGHAQRFLTESGPRTGEYIRELGAEILYAGQAGPEFCAHEDWDLVLLVRYPNFDCVRRTLTDDEIGPFVAELREATLEHSQFIVTQAFPTG